MSGRRAWASVALVGTIAVLALSALFAGGGMPGAGGRGPLPAALPTPRAGAVSPAAAFALGYAGRSPGAISLNWTESTAGFFGNYSIFYSTSSDRGPWTYYTDIASEATTSLVVPGLAPGGTYFWNVTAYSTGFLGIGASTTYSKVLNDTQPTAAYLTDSSVTSTSLTLSWTNNATYGGGIAFGSYAVEEVDDGATTLADNLTSATPTSAPIAGLSAGSSYSFYVTTYDCVAGCGTGAPSYSSTGSNVVNAGTAAALTASVAPVSATTDTGLPTGFTCTQAGGTAPYAFAWNFVNGSSYTAGPAAQSHVYAAAATYTVTCQVTDPTQTVVTAPVTVTVHAAPKVSASASPLNVTAGDAVRFTCVGTPGSAPLSVGWTLGDGATLDGAAGADGANGSASYAASGTYVAHCTVTDAVGASATASVVVHVQPRASSPWFPTYLVLVLGAVAGAIAAVVVGVARRRDEHASRSSALSRWLPPTGPAATVHGTKICPKCGASNVPLRRTCQACGTPLPRNPSP